LDESTAEITRKKDTYAMHLWWIHR